MPTLKHFPAQGAPTLYAVHKPVTTIGRALGNDVSLKADGVAEHHAQIVFDGRDFILEEIDRVAEIAINQKRKRRARLVHGDRLLIGAAELGFSMFAELTKRTRSNDDDDEPAARPIDKTGTGQVSSELAGVRKLFSFSEKLINRKNVDDLLEAMLDDVIELTNAQKGFLILVEGADNFSGESDKPGQEKKLVVRASRNVRKEGISDAGGGISDSIVRQVIESGRPVIVSDALADTTFGKSESVIAMKLSSVMCAPLVSQGQVIGALYVGNDKVKHLFERTQLELLASSRRRRRSSSRTRCSSTPCAPTRPSSRPSSRTSASARSSAPAPACSRCSASSRRSPPPTSASSSRARPAPARS
jgi:hypothetical protein